MKQRRLTTKDHHFSGRHKKSVKASRGTSYDYISTVSTRVVTVRTADAKECSTRSLYILGKVGGEAKHQMKVLVNM